VSKDYVRSSGCTGGNEKVVGIFEETEGRTVDPSTTLLACRAENWGGENLNQKRGGQGRVKKRNWVGETKKRESKLRTENGKGGRRKNAVY